jgi:putative serine protease PepD
MSGLKALALAAMSVFAVIGAGAVLIASGAVGKPAAEKADTANLRPVADVKPSGSLSGLYRQVKDGVAFIQAGQASGSGFVIDTQGHIVTNEHVVAESSTFQVRIGEKGKLVNATLLGSDASTDLAVLKVDPAETGALHPLPLGDSGKVQVGQSVIAIGSPYGLQGTLTSGIVSALNRDIQSPGGQTISGALQTDAAINPGNSGGPLLNRAGQVVGVNAQIATASGGSAGVGFAIPISMVKTAIPQLEAGQGAAAAQDQTQQDDGTTLGDGTTQGDGSDPQQVDPYGQSDPQTEQTDPTDPYGDQQTDPDSGSTQVDPYGDSTQEDPNGDSGSDQQDPTGDLLSQIG